MNATHKRNLSKNVYRNIIPIKQCYHCGYDKDTSALVIHHIDRNRKNNKAENLIVLCEICHRNLHDDKWKLSDIGIYEPPRPPRKSKQFRTQLRKMNIVKEKYQNKIKIEKCDHCGFNVKNLLHIYYKYVSDESEKWRVLCPNCYGSLKYNKWKLEEIGLK